MRIVVNGETRDFAQVANLAELVEALTLWPETLLIEHNGLALHRAEWPARELRDGDAVEFVRLTAGG